MKMLNKYSFYVAMDHKPPIQCININEAMWYLNKHIKHLLGSIKVYVYGPTSTRRVISQHSYDHTDTKGYKIIRISRHTRTHLIFKKQIQC